MGMGESKDGVAASSSRFLARLKFSFHNSRIRKLATAAATVAAVMLFRILTVAASITTPSPSCAQKGTTNLPCAGFARRISHCGNACPRKTRALKVDPAGEEVGRRRRGNLIFLDSPARALYADGRK